MLRGFASQQIFGPAISEAAGLRCAKEPNPTKYQKTLGLNDFYFGMPGFEFPMGNIQMVGKSQTQIERGAD